MPKKKFLGPENNTKINEYVIFGDFSAILGKFNSGSPQLGPKFSKGLNLDFGRIHPVKSAKEFSSGDNVRCAFRTIAFEG